MNILFTLNNAFVPQVATCMCSIFENNKSMDEINIYLIPISLRLIKLNYKNSLNFMVVQFILLLYLILGA